MEIIEKNILYFNKENDYKPSNKLPKEDGFYMTIRCGYGGIYTDFNEWHEGHWIKQVLDGSNIIAYSTEPVLNDKANEYLKTRIKTMIDRTDEKIEFDNRLENLQNELLKEE